MARPINGNEQHAELAGEMIGWRCLEPRAWPAVEIKGRLALSITVLGKAQPSAIAQTHLTGRRSSPQGFCLRSHHHPQQTTGGSQFKEVSSPLYSAKRRAALMAPAP